MKEIKIRRKEKNQLFQIKHQSCSVHRAYNRTLKFGIFVEASPVASQSEQGQASNTGNVTHENPNLSPDAPVTSLQIRLADGSRHIAKFNTTSTIGELRKWAIQKSPKFVAKLVSAGFFQFSQSDFLSLRTWETIGIEGEDEEKGQLSKMKKLLTCTSSVL